MSVLLGHMQWRPDASYRLVVGHHLLIELEWIVAALLQILPELLDDLGSALIPDIHAAVFPVVVVKNQLWMTSLFLDFKISVLEVRGKLGQ